MVLTVGIMYLEGYLDECWMNALTILCITSRKVKTTFQTCAME
jgi:hypothetical protein